MPPHSLPFTAAATSSSPRPARRGAGVRCRRQIRPGPHRPRARAIAVRTVHGEEQVVVAANLDPKEEVDTLTVFAPLGGRSMLSLSLAVRNCHSMRADAAGNLYLAADQSQIYKFDAQGSSRR